MFDVFAPAIVTLADLMIRNGVGLERGGGIRNTGTLTLDRVIVRANQALATACALLAQGGGIANDGRAEEALHRGLTSGCNASPPAFCPAVPATRAQIALFLVRAYGFGF